MMPPPVPVTCPQCRTALPAGAPRGLCPACLMDAAGVDSEAGTIADPFAAPLDLDTLRRAFPQFEILAPVGAGGMGRVYKVRQPNLDRIVALKVLPPEFARDPAWVERFTREARALARLNHPHIVQVYDVGQTTAAANIPVLCWLAMEYVDGVSLRQVQRTGGLSAREALALIPRLCDALQYAHEKGVLHRDIKPENILLDAAGQVKIADFGLAKLGGPNPLPTLTLTGARLGTATYMAPEQIESPQDVDHRADIYSLGVVFYELLTGGLPLGRFPAPSEKSGVDPRLDHIVFRTLEKERERRYQAAGEVRTALDTIAAAPAPPTPPPVPPQPARSSPKPPPPRLVETKHPLPSDAPPDLPPGRVARVSFHQLAWDGLGPVVKACKYVLGAPGRIALMFAAAFIPIAWHGILAEIHRPALTGFYPDSMIWVAALTGLTAWMASASLTKFLHLSKWNGLRRKAPFFVLLALVLWGAMLILISGASQSWPTRGAIRTLTLSAHRAPIQEEPGIRNAEPDSRFREFSLEEFQYDTRAILRMPGMTPVTEVQLDDRSPVKLEDAAVRQEWKLSAAARSVSILDAKLLRVAKRMIASLPETVRGSITIALDGVHTPPVPWRLNLYREEILLVIGFVMAIAGWLAGLTQGRMLLHAAAPILLLTGTAALELRPVSWVPGGLIVPAYVESFPEPPRPPALEELATKAASGNDPETAAVYRFIDACRRYDREIAMAFTSRPRDDDGWKYLASTWLANDLLSIVRQPLVPDGKSGAVFNCVLIRRRTAEPDEVFGRRYRYYDETYGESIKSFSQKLTVTKSGEGWKIE